MENNMASSRRDFGVHPAARIGYVSLNVSDLDESLDFYRSVLGFKVGKVSNGKALLSVRESPSHLVKLHEVRGASEPSATLQKRAGLYHFAILLPERSYLADMLQNLREKQSQVHFDGMSDHLVSESIYIRDPDFNGIEIYRDRPQAQWRWDGSQVRMSTVRLDTEDLMKESTPSGWKEMPAKTVIGHVHLHVSDLAKAMRFYSERLGLNFTASYPGAYFFAAGRYHHHIATNTWLGTGIAPAAPDNVGLNHFGIELPDDEDLEGVLKRITGRGDTGRMEPAFVQDPDGIRIRVYSRSEMTQ